MSDKVTTGGVSPRADKIFKIIITVLALVMCFIQIGKYISIGGKPIVNMYYLRIYALHYMFGMLFAFLMYDWKGKASGWTGLKKKWPKKNASYVNGMSVYSVRKDEWTRLMTGRWITRLTIICHHRHLNR